MCGSEVISREEAAWRVLRVLPDPEVPAISLVDLGIVRDVHLRDDGGVQVVLTPTYSGCPATEAIERSVREALDEAGLGPVHIALQRAPAWTTDWISDEGREKLRAYGIAPPGRCAQALEQPVRFHTAPAVDCPRCGSPRTQRLSAFGSTACKSLYRCLACAEPFEFFKPL
jgi:ring-1,2-phenylacetyl-CoA epoxidase subunit PaaD